MLRLKSFSDYLSPILTWLKSESRKVLFKTLQNSPFSEGQPMFADSLNTPFREGRPMFSDFLNGPFIEGWPTFADFLNTP